MAAKAKRARRGDSTGLMRSQIVSVRLDPRLRYLAEIAALKQRRTLSSFIEWAVEQALQNVVLREDGARMTTVADATDVLWDVDSADRFVRLAIHYPELLNHDQQRLWKLVRETDALWTRRSGPASRRAMSPDDLNLPRVRKNWDTLIRVASGELGIDALPPWLDTPPEIPSSEIPF